MGDLISHFLIWWLPLSKKVYEVLTSRYQDEIVQQLMVGLLPTYYFNKEIK